MISIENVKHFVAAVESQGVLRAAEKVFISPSSITRSIQQIETELGKPLFDRVSRKVALNQEGQRFYEKARDLLEAHALLIRDGKESSDLRGHYRIGASHFLCASLLSEVLCGLMAKYRRATIEVSSLDSHALVKKIHTGEIDLGLSFSPKCSDPIESEKIREGQLFLCAAKSHPLMGRPFAEVRKKLGDYPCIIHRPNESIERCDNHPMFKKHRIVPSIQAYWDSDFFAISTLANSEHWSMLPDVVIESDPRIAKLNHPRDWKAPYEIVLLWSRKRVVIDLKGAVMKEIEGRNFVSV